MELLDTTFLIDLMKGKDEVKKIASKNQLVTTQINMYEVLKGLFMRNMSPSNFLRVTNCLNDILVLQVDDNSVIRAADIYSNLKKIGKISSNSDCLIAGIALANGVNKIVTRNVKHFENIKGIEVVEY